MTKAFLLYLLGPSLPCLPLCPGSSLRLDFSFSHVVSQIILRTLANYIYSCPCKLYSCFILQTVSMFYLANCICTLANCICTLANCIHALFFTSLGLKLWPYCPWCRHRPKTSFQSGLILTASLPKNWVKTFFPNCHCMFQRFSI